MQNLINIQTINWTAILIPLGTFTATFLILLLARSILFRWLHRWAEGTESHLDDFVIGSIRTPFLLWSLMISLMAAMWVAPLGERYTALGSKTLLVLLILSMTLAAARIAGAAVRHYGSTSSGVVPGTSLTQNIVSMVVASIGLLILLNSLGITITPILTAMGVGGLAVALALQDTLANLFAGFYVSLSGQIRIGDYVRLDTGHEGTVADIGWRAVTIRAMQNNMIIVPNSKLAQAIVTNFHLNEARMSLRIEVGVSYDSDPDHIEAILLDEARLAIGQVDNLLGDPAPVVRFMPGFGDSSLGFTLIVQIAQFTDQFPIQHELRKRIFKRFRAEGIEIPFPIRTLYIRKEGGEADKTLSAGG
jgi:small-conductance mechanosensitive channel